MKWNFMYFIVAGFMVLGIIWKGYKYNGNPIFASYNLILWILAVIMFVGAYFFYKHGNAK